MSQDKPIDPKGTSPDDLTKTTKRGNVELSEEELKKASGGAFNAYIKLDGTGESSTTNSESVTLNKNVKLWSKI